MLSFHSQVKRAVSRTHGALCLSLLLAAPWRASALPVGFTQETLASGLDAVAVKTAADGRVFFTEKRGAIRIYKGGKLLPAPFVDISGKVDATMEKGMLGLALDPDFTANGFVYAFYVDKNHSGYVLRWTAQGDAAATGSEKLIFDAGVTGDGNFHHGGDIAFGADGKLYLTRGNRQDVATSKETTSLFGKLLRFNKDGSIPDDNPNYATNQGNARAVYAWGLRNPQSLALDPAKGRMTFLDISDATVDDEIDLVQKGAHYGAYSAGTVSGLIKKGDGGSAIMGSVFCSKKRASDLLSFPAEYHGKLFWGQFGGAGIRILDPDTKKVTRFDDAIDAPINFDIGVEGALYLVTRTTQVFDTKGKLIRIRYPAGETPTVLPGMAPITESTIHWSYGPGGRLDVNVEAPGKHHLEIRNLKGGLVSRIGINGAGSHSMGPVASKGIHFLVLRAEPEGKVEAIFPILGAAAAESR